MILRSLFIFIYLLSSPVDGYSQLSNTDSLFKGAAHELQVSPMSATFQKHMYWTHGMEYTWRSSSVFSVHTMAHGTLVDRFDFNVARGEGNRTLLHFGEVQVDFNYRFNLGESIVKRSKQVQWSMNATLGYHFLQRGADVFSWDYWIIDTTAGGYKMLGGTRVHSMLLGVEFNRSTVSRRNEEKCFNVLHQWGIAYLSAVHSNVWKYNDLEDGSLSGVGMIENQFGLRNHGAKIYHKYLHSFDNGFGIGLSTEVLWTPTVDYRYNNEFAVLRGGEGLSWLIFSCKPTIRIAF